MLRSSGEDALGPGRLAKQSCVTRRIGQRAAISFSSRRERVEDDYDTEWDRVDKNYEPK